MPVGAILGVGSALIGASSAKKAANAQSASADAQIRSQEETRDMIRADLAGYRQGGDLGRDALLYELGLGSKPIIGGNALAIEEVPGQITPLAPVAEGDKPNSIQRIFAERQARQPGPSTFRVNGQTFATRDEAQAYATANSTGGTEYQGFQATPGYQFQVDQGNASINALAGARGGLNSGRTMQDLSKFNQGIANQEYGNYLNRLGGISDMGLNAAAMQGTASSNAAAGISNALANKGNAQAAGAIGVGNAINTGIGNVLGTLNYQKGLNGGASNANVFSAGWGSSGFWG